MNRIDHTPRFDHFKNQKSKIKNQKSKINNHQSSLDNHHSTIINPSLEITPGLSPRLLMNSVAGLGTRVYPKKKDLRSSRPGRCDHPLTQTKLHLPGL